MQANKGRDTVPELLVRRILHADGFRYLVNVRPVATLRRTADITFTSVQLAVFIDGCFWHGCLVHYQRPARNREYWDAKVTGNRERDAQTTESLTSSGWHVLRFWEHDAVGDPSAVARRIEDEFKALRLELRRPRP
jgi:DNA mismatch endonuclease, patch repair protein